MIHAGKKDRGRYPNKIYIKIHPAVLAGFLLILEPALVACQSAVPELDFTDQEYLENLHAGDQGGSGYIDLQPQNGMTGPFRSLDIFIFNQDPQRRLDAYTRRENIVQPYALAAARNGIKWVAVLANASLNPYTWSHINSWTSLQNHLMQLEEEDPGIPILTGCMEAEGNLPDYQELILTPLLAKITIRNLACHFTGNYAGKTLEEVRCYLTYVSDQHPAFQDEIWTATSFLNAGRLLETDIQRMKKPEMIFQDLRQDLPDGCSTGGFSFYCYPNVLDHPSISHPFTRLVIEGKIDGTTCYYPLNLNFPAPFPDGAINVDADEHPWKGVWGGIEYEMSIELTRPGVKDPDFALSPESLTVSFSPKVWKEKAKETIDF